MRHSFIHEKRAKKTGPALTRGCVALGPEAARVGLCLAWDCVTGAYGLHLHPKQTSTKTQQLYTVFSGPARGLLLRASDCLMPDMT